MEAYKLIVILKDNFSFHHVWYTGCPHTTETDNSIFLLRMHLVTDMYAPSLAFSSDNSIFSNLPHLPHLSPKTQENTLFCCCFSFFWVMKLVYVFQIKSIIHQTIVMCSFFKIYFLQRLINWKNDFSTCIYLTKTSLIHVNYVTLNFHYQIFLFLVNH